MELAIYNQDGTEAERTASLEPSVFEIEPHEHVVWLDVRRIQAAGRQGTSKTKERNEVQGSGRKLYRQKGTGRARAGDAKSPIRQTGGRAHGARPRSYRLNLNKKTRRLARRSVLSDKAREGNLRVIEDFSMDRPSSRQLVALLRQLELGDRNVLVLTAEHERDIYLSSRNLSKLSVKEGRNASTLDLLKADVVLAQEGALEALTDILQPASRPKAAAS